MRATDAWMTMCWTNDGAQLNRDMPEIAYRARQGWRRDLDAISTPSRRSAPNKPAGYALLNYLMDPENAVKEHIANGAPTDRQPRARAAAEGGDLEQDRLSRRGIADAAGIRRRGDADRSGPRRADGALQVGLIEHARRRTDRPSPREARMTGRSVG